MRQEFKMIRAAVCLPLVVALVACDPDTVEPADAPVAVETPAEADDPPPEMFLGDFIVRGNEPFWAVIVAADTLTFREPGDEEVRERATQNPGPRVEGNSATWTTDLLTMTLTEATCSDGMSDMVYGWSAVVLIDERELRGCAERPSVALAGGD
jgi:uncharacterized membrane protein